MFLLLVASSLYNGILGDLNRRTQCSNPLTVLQVTIELSKNGFLQREGRKGSFLLPDFKNWSHHALYIWRLCHCPLLYDCLVIQAGWKGWFDSTSCLGQSAEMLGTDACFSSVCHGMERWCETGQGLSNNTRPYFWDTRWNLIKFLNQFWSWWFKNNITMIDSSSNCFFSEQQPNDYIKKLQKKLFFC